MNHSVQRVLAQAIVNAGHGVLINDPARTAVDWFVVAANKFPDDDENQYPIGIAVASAEGQDEGVRNIRTGENSMRSGAMVMVRAPTDEEAAPKAVALAEFVDTIIHLSFVLEGSTYCLTNVTRKYDPTYLMEEERLNRRVWGFRCLVTAKKTL